MFTGYSNEDTRELGEWIDDQELDVWKEKAELAEGDSDRLADVLKKSFRDFREVDTEKVDWIEIAEGIMFEE